MPEEVRFFLRIGGFGVAIGVAYWFLTYDPAGTVLLVAFGLATLVVTVPLALRALRAVGATVLDPREWLGLTKEGSESPFVGDPERLPGASFAPFALGLGIALGALGLVYGAWLVFLGLALAVLGGATWARESAAEWRSGAAVTGSGYRPVADSRATMARRTSAPRTSQPARRRRSPDRPR
jgi:hypothetical protein